MPHGLSNALVLPHVLGFNAPDAYAAYAEIAADAFPHLAEVDALTDLSLRLGMPTRLREVGIPDTALEKMAADAMVQTRLLANNPRAMSEHDVLTIYNGNCPA